MPVAELVHAPVPLVPAVTVPQEKMLAAFAVVPEKVKLPGVVAVTVKVLPLE